MRSGMFSAGHENPTLLTIVADISILMMDHHLMTRVCSPGVFQELPVEVLLSQAPGHLQIPRTIGSHPYPHCHKAAGVRVPLVGGPIGPVLLSLIVIEKGSDLQTPTSLPRARSPYSPAPTGGWLRRAFFLLIFFCHLSKMHLTRRHPWFSTSSKIGRHGNVPFAPRCLPVKTNNFHSPKRIEKEITPFLLLTHAAFSG